MSTDHRDRARQHLESARCLKGTDIPAEDRHLRYAQVHATLADRCPDPAAHQTEDTGELDSLRKRLTEALDLDEDDSDDEIVHTVRMRLASRDGYDAFIQAHRLIADLRKELAEARAARPALEIADDELIAVLAGAAEHPDDLHLADEEAMRVVIELLRDHGFAVVEHASAARPAPTEDSDLREQLAEIEHRRWSDWQRYQHSMCERLEDGSLRIPADKVKHWERQIGTRYADLSEREKESDRHQVDRYWHLVARPAPMPPEVVAVVEAWTDWDGDPASDGMRTVTVAIEDLRRALPEGWRDGAAPSAEPVNDDTTVRVPRVHLRSWAEFLRELVNQGAVRTLNAKDATEANAGRIESWASLPAPPAVPAVLDEAGVERAARLLAEQRGVSGKQYDALPSFTMTAGIERARAAVRAYLGDTDTEGQA